MEYAIEATKVRYTDAPLNMAPPSWSLPVARVDCSRYQDIRGCGHGSGEESDLSSNGAQQY